MTTTMMKVQDITVRDGWNPRTVRDDEEMASLIETVRQLGVIVPVIVNADGELIEGHRRIHAAMAVGLEDVPAIRNTTDGTDLLVAAVSNLRREQLQPVDEARLYHRLVKEGHTMADVAALVGVPERRVASRMRLLGLPDDVQVLINDRTVPLAAVPAIEQAAAVSLRLAPRVAAAVVADGPVSVATLQNVDAQNARYTLGRALASWDPDDFSQPLDTWVDVKHIMKVIVESDPEEVHAAVRDRGWIQFTQEDVEAAQAFGCMFGPLCVDREFFLDRVVIAAARKDLEDARRREELHANVAAIEPTSVDAEAVKREERRVYDRVRRARMFNEQLGVLLYENHHEDTTSDLALVAVKVAVLRAIQPDITTYATAAAIVNPAGGVSDQLVNSDIAAAEGRIIETITEASEVAQVLGRFVELTAAVFAAKPDALRHNTGYACGVIHSYDYETWNTDDPLSADVTAFTREIVDAALKPLTAHRVRVLDQYDVAVEAQRRPAGSDQEVSVG
jgi:ParB/RepB/Spo0J family partition protein